MTHNFEFDFESPAREEILTIRVECHYIVENDGIGPYEFWGFRGNDRGVDYILIEKVEWDQTGFSPEEIQLIEKEIDKNIPTWEEDIGESLRHEKEENFPIEDF